MFPVTFDVTDPAEEARELRRQVSRAYLAACAVQGCAELAGGRPGRRVALVVELDGLGRVVDDVARVVREALQGTAYDHPAQVTGVQVGEPGRAVRHDGTIVKAARCGPPRLRITVAHLDVAAPEGLEGQGGALGFAGAAPAV
jgi:hypothetical protein